MIFRNRLRVSLFEDFVGRSGIRKSLDFAPLSFNVIMVRAIVRNQYYVHVYCVKIVFFLHLLCL